MIPFVRKTKPMIRRVLIKFTVILRMRPNVKWANRLVQVWLAHIGIGHLVERKRPMDSSTYLRVPVRTLRDGLPKKLLTRVVCLPEVLGVDALAER